MCFESDHDVVPASEGRRTRDAKSGARTSRESDRASASLRTDTHWSRILSCDLENDADLWSGATASRLHEADSPDGDARGIRQRVVTTAIVVFAVFALAYLAVTGGLHLLDSPGAAIVPAVPAPDHPLSHNSLA